MANAVTAFLDVHAGTTHRDRAAIVTPSATVSYGELLGRVCRAGRVLRELGVEPEQRVALLLSDGVEWAVTFLAALRIGAVAVPLNTRLAVQDWTASLCDSRAKALVAEPGLARAVFATRTDLPALKHVLSAGPADGLTDMAGLAARAAPDLEPQPVSDDDMAFWLYTSGTTGEPKAAIHLHRDLLACRHYGMEILETTADDRAFATSKLFFAYALGNALLIPLFAGARSFLHPAWPDAEQVTDVMHRFAPTLFFSVPTFYAKLLRAELPRDLFRSVRCAVSAGERLPAEIYWGFRDRFGLEILDGLGATETIFMVLSNRPGHSRPGAAGQPVPGTEARLLNADGLTVPAGEQGVLHVKTPSASPGYWARADQSRRTFVGEWFRTGDVCTRDAEGFYYHCGRADDLFKVAGMWVSPADVETVLAAHPAVAEAGVAGREEEGGLVKPFAWIVPREPTMDPTALFDELRALADKKLAPHQRPRRFAVVDELPRTATGKLQRFRLRAWAG